MMLLLLLTTLAAKNKFAITPPVGGGIDLGENKLRKIKKGVQMAALELAQGGTEVYFRFGGKVNSKKIKFSIEEARGENDDKKRATEVEVWRGRATFTAKRKISSKKKLRLEHPPAVTNEEEVPDLEDDGEEDSDFEENDEYGIFIFELSRK